MVDKKGQSFILRTKLRVGGDRLPEEQFLTVKEVADLLRVTRQAVHNWIRQGKLDAIKLGDRTLRIPAVAVERFIAEGREAVAAEQEQRRLGEIQTPNLAAIVDTHC